MYGLAVKYIKVLNELNWKIKNIEGADGYNMILEKDSPAGENISMLISAYNDKQFVQEVKEYLLSFDVDQHVTGWFNFRGQKFYDGRIVPKTIKELVNDAEAVRDMLFELWAELEKTDIRIQKGLIDENKMISDCRRALSD